MSPAEYSTFIRDTDWVRLDLEECGHVLNAEESECSYCAN